MAQILAFKIKNKLSDSKRHELLSILSFSEKEKVYRFKRSQDAEISLISRYLLRKIISSFTQVESNELVFTQNKFGRPILKYPKIDNFDFNVSHSGKWIVVVMSEYSRVGIDIEEIKPIDLSIAKDVYTIEELQYLYQQSGKEIENFYKIWTLKESFIKAIGEGLSYPLKNFYFDIRGNTISIKNCDDGWYFKTYNIDTNYKMAICLNKNDFPKQITMFGI